MTSRNVKTPTDDGNIIHGTKPESSGNPVFPLDGSSYTVAIGNIDALVDAGGVTEIIVVG